MKDLYTPGLASSPGGMATADWVLPEVFVSLCRAEAAKVQDFSPQEFANTLGARAKTGRVKPEVFDSPSRAVPAKVKDFGAQDLANSRWGMSKGCDSLCHAAAAKVLGVSGSDSEGEGSLHARPRQLAGGHGHSRLGPA